MSFTAGIITDESTAPHFRLSMDLTDGENVDIGLDGAKVSWESTRSDSGLIIEAIYDGIKINLIVSAKLGELQKQTIYTMLAGALQSAARRS